MGNEGTNQEYIRSNLKINKTTDSQTIKVAAQPAPICELIYIPETGEMVGLTTAEIAEFLDTAERFDKPIKAVLAANKSGDQNAISRAKEQLADFIADEAKKVIANPAPKPSDGTPPLHTFEHQEFIEVMQFGGKKWRFMPRNLIETFRKKKKIYPLTQAAKQAYNKHAKAKPVTAKDVTAELPTLRTRKREIKMDRIKQQFGKFKVNAKWNLIEPTSKQLPAKYTLMLFGGPIASALGASGLFDRWLDGVDTFIAKLNENLKVAYNDRDEHKKKLIELLTPKQGSGQKKDTFDESSFGKFQSEVAYIWEESDEQTHLDLVDEVKKQKWEKFEKDLKTNRKKWADRLKATELPEYIFNASAQAQFLRYGYGATASAEFDPSTGKLSVKGEANASASLVEGKANAIWFLPSNRGFDLKIKNNAGSSFFVWKPIEYHTPSVATFVTDRSFILPASGQKLQEIINAWELNGRESHSHALHVIGHADTRGNSPYNLALSERRAQSAYELMTYDYKAWMARFESKEWGHLEIKTMLSVFTGKQPDDRNLAHTSWVKVIKKYQLSKLEKPVQPGPVFVGMEDGCDVKNLTRPLHALRPDGKIGVANSYEKQTLKWLIEDYMLKVLKEKFMLPEYFFNPESSGRGETDLAKQQEGDIDENRRLTFKVLERKQIKGGKTDEYIPLGKLRFNIELYLTGFVGANVFVSAELAFSGTGGKGQLKGLRAGESAKLEKNAKVEKRGRPSYKFDDGLKSTAGAFAGAQATAGVKGMAEWKAPDISPTMRMPNPLVRPGKPMKVCTTEKQAADLLKEWGIDKKGFLELASMGYAVTGTAGVGLEGEFQIGFDETKGKFLIKAHAKASLGLGFGGAFEFSISAKHVYFFIRFVHTQLNDHNFSYLEFFDEKAFEIFSAWSYKLLTEGRLLESGFMALGAVGMNMLGSIKIVTDAWSDHSQSTAIANELADLVNNKGTALLSFSTPEVKARLIHKICYGEYLKDDKNKEQAVMIVLSTLASKREYQEVLEHMNPNPIKSPRPKDKNDTIAEKKREAEKKDRRKDAESRITWLLDNEMQDEFDKWYKNLSEVAPPIGK